VRISALSAPRASRWRSQPTAGTTPTNEGWLRRARARHCEAGRRTGPGPGEPGDREQPRRRRGRYLQPEGAEVAIVGVDGGIADGAEQLPVAVTVVDVGLDGEAGAWPCQPSPQTTIAVPGGPEFGSTTKVRSCAAAVAGMATSASRQLATTARLRANRDRMISPMAKAFPPPARRPRHYTASKAPQRRRSQ
jgi:hypothetical protein